MNIDMRGKRHLNITFNLPNGDRRQVIIDTEKDVRICDESSVVKVRFDGKKIKDVLRDDLFLTNQHLDLPR